MHKAFGTLMAIAVVAIVGTTAVEETACTPAQAAMVNQDVQAAAAILASLSPIACQLIDTADPTNAAAICQVITDVSTGATAIVPIFGTLVALTTVVQAKPPNAAVQAAATTIKLSWKPRVRT